MNRKKLRQAEASFLQVYPKGFADPAIQAIRRKHNVHRLVRFAGESLTPVRCHQPDAVCDALLTIIARSSLVSRFEKPRFKAFIGALASHEKEALAHAVEQRLHGRKRHGFEQMLGMLAHHRLARWSVLSVVPFYFAPRREVFVKPTTVKRILAYLEVDELRYAPTPSWSFYTGFRRLVLDIRKEISPSLSPTNAALTGFLMMSVTSAGAPIDAHVRLGRDRTDSGE